MEGKHGKALSTENPESKIRKEGSQYAPRR
jgi:hypothetical protein